MKVRRLIGAIFLLVALCFGVITWQRSQLPYNEEGRYFDPGEAVVYNEQSVMIWLVLSLACGLIGLVLALKRTN